MDKARTARQKGGLGARDVDPVTGLAIRGLLGRGVTKQEGRVICQGSVLAGGAKGPLYALSTREAEVFRTLLLDVSNHLSALLLSPELSFGYRSLDDRDDGGLACTLTGVLEPYLNPLAVARAGCFADGECINETDSWAGCRRGLSCRGEMDAG